MRDSGYKMHDDNMITIGKLREVTAHDQPTSRLVFEPLLPASNHGSCIMNPATYRNGLENIIA